MEGKGRRRLPRCHRTDVGLRRYVDERTLIMNDSNKGLSALREAINRFTPALQIEAQRELSEIGALNFEDGMQFTRALGALRAVFHRLELWESSHRFK
jgi:hypothetical protein